MFIISETYNYNNWVFITQVELFSLIVIKYPDICFPSFMSCWSFLWNKSPNSSLFNTSNISEPDAVIDATGAYFYEDQCRKKGKSTRYHCAQKVPIWCFLLSILFKHIQTLFSSIQSTRIVKNDTIYAEPFL